MTSKNGYPTLDSSFSKYRLHLNISNKDKTTCTRKEYDDLMYCFVASFANATNSSTTTYQLNWKS